MYICYIIPQTGLACKGSHGVALVPGTSKIWSRGATVEGFHPSAAGQPSKPAKPASQASKPVKPVKPVEPAKHVRPVSY